MNLCVLNSLILKSSALWWTPQQLGNVGEKIAASYLIKNNFFIWHQNWEFEGGEIDIICYQNHDLHFIEVKTRTLSVSKSFPGLLAVNAKKQKSIQRAASRFIRKNKREIKARRLWSIHYDVVSITVSLPFGRTVELNHYRDAF